MKEAERRILTTEKAAVIRNALCTLLARVNSEGDIAAGTRKRLEAFAKQGCEKLILDLRMAEKSSGGVSPGVRNLRASQLGPVLVVTGEATTPETLHEIEALCHQPLFPRHVASGLLAFVHMLF